MNHLESSFTGRNNFWRYPLMLAVIIVASNTIGSLPLLIAILIKSGSNPDLFSQLASDPNDFSVLGLDEIGGFILMLLPFIAGLIAFVLAVKPLHSRSFANTVNGTGRIRWNRFFISAFVWFALSGIYFFINFKIDPGNFSFNNRSVSLIVLTLISFLFIPFQAAFEEVVFRGYLMQGFTVIVRKRWFPLIMTSVLFGLLHAFNPEVREYGFFTMMPHYVLFGLLFGVITILDDGIESATGAHAANNIFLCIMVTGKSSALQTPALFEQQNIYPWTEFVSLLFIGILFILILALIFKWKNISILFEKIKV